MSLRGLGSTGASRSLVLWDGVPLNSPFGGWVYWTRIAPDELERVTDLAQADIRARLEEGCTCPMYYGHP